MKTTTKFIPWRASIEGQSISGEMPLEEVLKSLQAYRLMANAVMTADDNIDHVIYGRAEFDSKTDCMKYAHFYMSKFTDDEFNDVIETIKLFESCNPTIYNQIYAVHRTT